jgi:hypothetical protein
LTGNIKENIADRKDSQIDRLEKVLFSASRVVIRKEHITFSIYRSHSYYSTANEK